ncbi:hypothetical protein SynA1840_00430 [Synechococcus sp. A18-40]|nr:hypothetical protein SynA1840_00430 [Synechococcus sp. A18-40]
MAPDESSPTSDQQLGHRVGDALRTNHPTEGIRRWFLRLHSV